MNLTPQQKNVLKALAKFRYLTTSQMITLGISKSANALRNNTLKPLSKNRKKCISSHDYGWTPTQGKLHNVHFLTPCGAKVLAEIIGRDIDTISLPTETIWVSSDYDHRTQFVNFHIAFNHWAEREKKNIEFFHVYFDKIKRANKKQKVAKTQVQLERTVYTHLESKPVIPDGLTRYQDGNNSRLVAIEIHNVHSQQITQQLLEHLEAIEQGLFTGKFNHTGGVSFVLSVHENQSTLDSVKRRLIERSEFKAFLPLFLFNRQDQVKADFAKGWTLADGSKTALFP